MAETFGENLRNLRISRGYSQDKFAKTIGSNQVNISAWELGNRIPKLETIKHIAEVFHVPLSSLIPITNTRQNDDFAIEILDAMHKEPKIRMLFDRTRYMEPSDLDVVLSVCDAIARRRENE